MFRLIFLGNHFAEDIVEYIVLTEKVELQLEFWWKGLIDKKSI